MGLFTQMVREYTVPPTRHRSCRSCVLASWAYRDDFVVRRSNQRRILLLPCVLLLNVLLAQPQWRFHLAFEDATGVRDTIWLVYDVTATIGSGIDPEVDTALGEGGVPIAPNVFAVWTYNWNLDSTKTKALPYSFFPSFGLTIYAKDFTFPITISWDSSLFTGPPLPEPGIGSALMDCAYFFSYFNDGSIPHYFNMRLTDSTQVQYVSEQDWLFPLNLLFDADETSMDDSRPGCTRALAWPNPASDWVNLECLSDARLLVIRDDLGRIALSQTPTRSDSGFNVSGLCPGHYTVQVLTHQNHNYHASLIIER